ncbi:hypothetical protein E4O05_09410 [Treponema sp. OMZ 787]|uniref:hypothetical protein n=2 Tax=Treponema TaxID=157 RepID=UPI0020A505A3|nr:hypothetical protein [Treponema sp. OMZ 787]UTC61757.1 hypothetical protein E4O05_09410 [Treponema sp. OMZ 787]
MKTVYRKSLILRCLFFLTLIFFLYAAIITILTQEDISISIWIVMMTIISINAWALIDYVFSKIEFQEDVFTYKKVFIRVVIRKDEVDFARSLCDADIIKNKYIIYKKNGDKIKLKGGLDGFSMKTKMDLLADLLVFFRKKIYQRMNT